MLDTTDRLHVSEKIRYFPGHSVTQFQDRSGMGMRLGTFLSSQDSSESLCFLRRKEKLTASVVEREARDLTCLLEPPWAEIWMSTLASGKSKELSPTYRERTDIGCDLVEMLHI